MKKTLILGLIVCSLIVVSLNSAVAADETKTIVDDEGDVTDGLEIVTSSGNIYVDNIDILEVTYSRDGKSATFTLKVKGIIENRGDLDDITGEFDKDVDVILYVLSLGTSDETYDIYYINNECQITYYSTLDVVDIPDSDFSVDNNILTVSFDLNSTGETCESIMAMTMYTKMPDLSDVDPDDYDDYLDLTEQLFDEAYDEYDDGGDNDDNNGGDGTNDGGDNNDSNKNDDSSDSGLLLFGAVITIIFIMGVAVIVYIIRR